MNGKYLLSNLVLWGAILFGLLGALSLSYETFTGGDACPVISGFRACYVVAIAYLSIAIGAMVDQSRRIHMLFWIGWVIAFIFATYGSTLEAFQGNVCPRAGEGAPFWSVPLCYVSFSICLLIAGAFLMRKKYLKR